MDPLTVAVAGLIALTGLGSGERWRWRARRAEDELATLRAELATERYAASHDSLTGLPNRRAFYETGLASIRSSQHPLVVVVIDLDDFKRVNDEHGHAAGDEVLVTVARRFAAYAGDNLVARLGGDEFVGLLTSPTAEEHWRYLAARGLAEVLASPMPIDGRSLVVTASVGIASVRDAAGLFEAVRSADTAMYRDKARSRRAADRWRRDLQLTSERHPVKAGC